uniref:Ig-like domain-containing protein n=1 Tax=Strix occidentalis caurina TaxID=311401 RepID=A0A8D0KTI6_STROC
MCFISPSMHFTPHVSSLLFPGQALQQSPDTVVQVGDSVTLTCSEKENNYTTLAFIFWYQQPPRNGLKLVASISTWMKNSYEEGYSEAKFEISRDNNDHSVMTIKNVTSKDAATYFCAASDHTVQGGGKNDEIIPPAVAIFSPSKQEIQQKSKATLVCLASGFYPDYLKLFWKVNVSSHRQISVCILIPVLLTLSTRCVRFLLQELLVLLNLSDLYVRLKKKKKDRLWEDCTCML